MKPLKIDAPVASRKALLRKAETIPGAWYGIRIAGLLLLLTGWKTTAVSRLFGVSRQAIVDWVRKANSKGIDSVTRPLTSLRKLYVKRQKHWRTDKIRAFCKVT